MGLLHVAYVYMQEQSCKRASLGARKEEQSMKEVRAMSDQEWKPEDPVVDFMRASLADARAELEKTREELAKVKERAENAEKEVCRERDAWHSGYNLGLVDRKALLARVKELEWQMQRVSTKPKPQRSDKPVLVAQSGDRRVVRKPWGSRKHCYVMEGLSKDSMGAVKWFELHTTPPGMHIHKMMSLIEGLEWEA